jgi:hypothetical protein
MTCSSRSPDQTPSTRILSTLWLQVMYHQGRTKRSLSTRVISTFGIHRTSSESALTVYSGDVYLRKKASRSLNDTTYHHMEDIIGHYEIMQRFGRVDSFGQPCIKTRRILSGDVDRVRGTGILIQEMPCHTPITSRLSSSMSGELTI